MFAVIFPVASILSGCQSVGIAAQANTSNFERALTDLLASRPLPSQISIPQGVGKAIVCVKDKTLEELFPGAGIQSVTGFSPFLVVEQGSNDRCNIHIAKLKSKNLTSVQILKRYSQCGISSSSQNQLTIFPTEERFDRFSLAECFYRIALYLEGFSGAIDANVFNLNSKSAYFAGKRHYVGYLSTDIPQALYHTCPESKKLVFKRIDFQQLYALCKNLFKDHP